MFYFLLDHNVPKSIGDFLGQAGYGVQFVKEIDPEISDKKLIKWAISEQKILITNDKDFLNLSNFYPEADVILFDFLDQSSRVRINALEKILPHLKIHFGLIILQDSLLH